MSWSRIARLFRSHPRRRPYVRSRLEVNRLDSRDLPSSTFAGMGAASSFGVLQMNGGAMVLNQSQINGNVGLGTLGLAIGQNTTVNGSVSVAPLSLPLFLNGFHATGGVSQQNLAPAVNAANAVSVAAAALSPTQSFNNVTQSLVIEGNGGMNVIRMRSLEYRNDALTINGSASDVFVFNVQRDFDFRNSRIVLQGGVTADKVLFNFTSNGASVSIRHDNSVVFGTFLAPRGSVEYRDSADFQGAIFARNIQMLSGATLDNGSAEPPAGGTASISGTVYNDTDFSGSYVPGSDDYGISGVVIRLTGVDDLGNAVDVTTETDGDGNYSFNNLRAGTYTISEEQPFEYVDAAETVGTVNGVANGTLLDNDVIGDIVLADGQHGVGYLFGDVYSGG